MEGWVVGQGQSENAIPKITKKWLKTPKIPSKVHKNHLKSLQTPKPAENHQKQLIIGSNQQATTNRAIVKEKKIVKKSDNEGLLGVARPDRYYISHQKIEFFCVFCYF